MGEKEFELWLPNSGIPLDNNIKKEDLNSDTYLNWALQNVSFFEREETLKVVNHLVNLNNLYQAARCLEISAHHRLGVFFTGEELIDYRYPTFGEFHKDIKWLLEAGVLLIQDKRQKTAFNVLKRALIFVEEALRSIKEFTMDNSNELSCLGLAFELAGHCANMINDSNALEYYKASKSYWKKGEMISPLTILEWEEHPVTSVVISCLKSVSKIKKTIDPVLKEDIVNNNFEVRISAAEQLL